MASRPAFLPPLLPLEIVSRGAVLINHPGVGYPLFSFPAYSGEPDPNDRSKTLFGVCHPLALDACRVITNHAANHQEDFLAKDREGKTRVAIDDAQPLTPGDYYYFLGVPDKPPNYNYPIVKNFSAFRFPGQIPDNWYSARSSFKGVVQGIEVVSSSNMSSHVASRDKYCALSGNKSFNQCAHLVPKAEEAWFDANKMFIYSLENLAASVNSHTNGISLRDDVHRCFDSNAFVFYPGDGDTFRAYFVGMHGYPDYTELFHRRLATIHPSVAVEFLYARFAHTVIKLDRLSAVFDSVQDNPEVKVVAERKLLEKAEKQAHGPNRKAKEPPLPTIDEHGDTRMSGLSEDSRVSGGDEESDIESSSASNQSIQSPPQESYADGDERWKEELFRRLPGIATLEEVEHPPDGVACHTETPHMLRLTSKYMRENPQVWQTSTTPEGATRYDVEGFYAELITRPTST